MAHIYRLWHVDVAPMSPRDTPRVNTADAGFVADANKMFVGALVTAWNKRRWQMNRSILLSATLGLASAVFSTAASAATFVVNSTLDVQDANAGNGVCATASGTCTLRAAITEANALAGADIITLPAGTYTTTLISADEDGNLGGDFDINSNIMVNGAGAATTIVQAATTAGVATERVFHLRFVAPGTTVVLNDMTTRHGRLTGSTYGAGVQVVGGGVIATFNRVRIANNENAGPGGGLAIVGATGSITTLDGCRVENNTSGSRGAGIQLADSSATLNINDSIITGNVIASTASVDAAGVYSQGTMHITNSVVSNNTSTSSGSNSFSGGVSVIAGVTTISSSRISNNSSTVTAGVGFGIGGGIYNQNANITLTETMVFGNTASTSAGGISSRGFTGTTTTNIIDSTIANNTAVLYAGGVENFAVLSTASATTNVTRSTVSANSVSGPDSRGGGIDSRSGGSGTAVVNITSSTFSGNAAASGAGIHNIETSSESTATINTIFLTISGNTAIVEGGGLFQAPDGGTINLRNSIVANNAAPAGPDISGAVTSQFFNHVENISGATFTPDFGDVVGTDPQLGPLASNGGSTLTHLPASSSPVIDAIPNGSITCGITASTAQNGVARPQGAGCEKGSVEVDFDLIFRNGFDGTGNVIGAQLVD